MQIFCKNMFHKKFFLKKKKKKSKKKKKKKIPDNIYSRSRFTKEVY